jgi:hypothetical protein
MPSQISLIRNKFQSALLAEVKVSVQNDHFMVYVVGYDYCTPISNYAQVISNLDAIGVSCENCLGDDDCRRYYDFYLPVSNFDTFMRATI